MGKQKCILGNNCPNKIAKRNIQFQLSEDDNNLSLQENCVFCGTYTAKKKAVDPPSSPWSTSSNISMKRAAMTDIDSLCGLKSMSKKKKEDVDDRLNFFRSQVISNSKKLSKAFSDSDSDDLSDSGVKSDYESPGIEANNKKNNLLNGLNICKGRIVSRSPTPELDEITNNSSKNIFKSNGFNKDISNNNSFLAMEAAEDNRRDVSPSTSLLDNTKNASPPSSPHNSPFNNDSIVESDPFELDSDHETAKKISPVATTSNNSRDLSEAGPSSRPDVKFEDSTPSNSYEAHHSGFKSRFMNLTYMPKHKVERLLFKSFKLQILNEFSSSSDEDEIKLYQPPKKAEKRKRKPGESAPVKDAVFTSSQKIGSGFYRWKKRRRVQNSWSDDESNQTYISGEEDADDDDDDSDDDGLHQDVQPLRYLNSDQVHSEHDYSTSEFKKMDEANIENLAFETERLNWDDSIMIDDATMDSVSGRRTPVIKDEVITLDDSPKRFELPLIIPTDSVVTIHESDSEASKSPNTSDHLYCVIDQKRDDSPAKTAPVEKAIDADAEVQTAPAVPEDKGGPPAAGQKKPWECPICLEPSTGQEVTATICGHIFCRDCIESYLTQSCSTCPTCRRELDKKQLITLYNM